MGFRAQGFRVGGLKVSWVLTMHPELGYTVSNKRTSGLRAPQTDHSSKLAKSVLLGGPWDLVTTYNWAYSPTSTPPKWAYGGYPSYK